MSPKPRETSRMLDCVFLQYMRNKEEKRSPKVWRNLIVILPTSKEEKKKKNPSFYSVVMSPVGGEKTRLNSA